MGIDKLELNKSVFIIMYIFVFYLKLNVNLFNMIPIQHAIYNFPSIFLGHCFCELNSVVNFVTFADHARDYCKEILSLHKSTIVR